MKKGKNTMSAITHKSTAKASLRNLLAVHGKSGTLNLLAEVMAESLPSRRGRPTRDEAVTRLVLGALTTILPEVVSGEEKVAAVVTPSDEEG